MLIWGDIVNKKLLAAVLFLLLFVFCDTALSKPVVKPEKDKVIGRIIEEDKNYPAALEISSAEVKAVYADDRGIRAVLIESPCAIDSIEINSQSYSIDSEPDENGFIYAYFDGIEYSGGIDIALEGKVKTFSPIAVAETNDKWAVSDDGHTLVSYKGSSQDITVPNFYRGKIILNLGNGSCISDKNNTVSAVISEGIINIGDFCFYEMNTLKDITLPDTLETIGGAAFAYTSLENVIDIPESTREIYAYAFAYTKIKGVSFNECLERLCSYAFSNCRAMGGTLKLPQSLNYIGSWVFVNCSSLVGGVTIPGNVESVGEGAFFNCPEMTGEIVLEEGVTEIGMGAFGADSASHSGFTAVSFPSTLRKIGPYAFQLAAKIKHIDLPEGLEIISDGAFDHMTGLDNESLVIPSTVRIIGGDYNVDKNTGYGGHVFYDMGNNENFKSIEVADGNESFTSVDGVLYSKDMTRLVGYPRGKRDEVYEIPEGVLQMDELCFSRVAYLKRIVLPDSYIISEDVPPNVLNQDGNSLSVALYVYTAVNAVDVKPTNENYVSENGILYSKDRKSLWYIPNQYRGDINIAEGTERLEKGCVFVASRGNTLWGNIYLPQSFRYIHSDAAKFISTYFKGHYFGNRNGLFLYGDMNFNTAVDNTDAIILLKDIAIRSNMPYAGDYNLDGKTDIADVIAIMNAE